MSNWFTAASSSQAVQQQPLYHQPGTPQRQYQQENVSQQEVHDAQILTNKYLQSFTPGKKKSSGTKTTASPTGPSSFTEPSRFGNNSLYGTGAGVSPNKTPHRLSRPALTQSNSSSSPILSSSGSRSRMNTGGSVAGGYGSADRMDEDRPPAESYADLEGLDRRGIQLGSQPQQQRDDDDMNQGYDDDSETNTNLFMVYGLPPSKQEKVQSFLSSYGSLTYFESGPLESNYVIVGFEDPSVGIRLLRQSGSLRLDGWYIGIKEAGPDILPSTAPSNNTITSRQHTSSGIDGLPKQSSAQNQHQASRNQKNTSQNETSSSDPFASISTLTPIKSQSGTVFRPQTLSTTNSLPVMPAAYSFGTVQAPQQDAQDSQGGQNGYLGRFADVLFGR